MKKLKQAKVHACKVESHITSLVTGEDVKE